MREREREREREVCVCVCVCGERENTNWKSLMLKDIALGPHLDQSSNSQSLLYCNTYKYNH